MKHRLMFSLLVLTLVLSLIVSGGCAKEEKFASFTTGAWTGDWLTLYPIKILLEEELGYTTRIDETSVAMAWTAVGTGQADLWTNAWLPNQADLQAEFAETAISLGTIYGGGSHDPCLQFWAVPTSVSEQYGLTSIEQLDDPQFVEMFDTDGDGVGDLLGCDAAWKCAAINDEIIVAYGLKGTYEQKYGAESMITAAIVGSMKKGEPALFYFYTPHPFFIDYPIGEAVTILEDPKGGWGELATVIKVANHEWIEANPKAAELIRQVTMTQEDIAWSMVQVDDRGDDAATLEAIAREWMADHQTEVDAWVAAVK